MGVTGVNAKTGLTTGDFEEAAVKRALSQAAAETFVLASAEKLGAASPYAVVPLEDVSGLIVERLADRGLTKPFEKRKIPIFWA